MGLPLRGIDQPPSRVTGRVWAGLQPGPINLRAARVKPRAGGYLEGLNCPHTLSQVRTREQGPRLAAGAELSTGRLEAANWGRKVDCIGKLDVVRGFCGRRAGSSREPKWTASTLGGTSRSGVCKLGEGVGSCDGNKLEGGL